MATVLPFALVRAVIDGGHIGDGPSGLKRRSVFNSRLQARRSSSGLDKTRRFVQTTPVRTRVFGRRSAGRQWGLAVSSPSVTATPRARTGPFHGSLTRTCVIFFGIEVAVPFFHFFSYFHDITILDAIFAV